MSSLSFAYRNIKHYTRDTRAILFSLLSVFIIIGLYVFFLAKVQTDYVSSMIGANENMDVLIGYWVLGGLVCIPAVNVPLMVLSFMIDDTVDGTDNDLLVTNAPRISILLGHILAAFIVGFIMTLLTLFLGLIYIVAIGGPLLSTSALLKVIGIIALTLFAFTSFTYLILSFAKTRSASNTVNTIYNTLIGFLAGLYIPMGALSKPVANVIKLFPLAQAVSILRQIMTKKAIETTFSGVAEPIILEFKAYYGIILPINDYQLTTSNLILMLVLFTCVCYSASAYKLYTHKRK